MAYDDSRFRADTDRRPGGGPINNGTNPAAPSSGGYPAGTYPVAGFAGPMGDTGSRATRRAPTTAQLDDVFDDPTHGEPGRDRMTVHLLWELVLLLAVAAVVYLLREYEPAALRDARLRELFVFTAGLGIATVGMALSLRAAAPNLAIGPIAYASGLFFADNSDRGLLPTAGVTALLAIGAGLAIAVVVVGFHVPGWAASLAAAFAVIVWIQRHRDTVEVVNGAYQPTRHAMYWYLGFAALSLLGGLLGLAKPIRRAVGRFRPVADPARRRGGGAGGLTALSIVGSTLLAAVAGVLLALHNRTVDPAENGLALTGLALGAALLGGTSVFGRRGGVLGTVLAVTLLALVVTYAAAGGWRLSNLGVAAALIGFGLLISRLVETFGRPRSAVDADEPAEEPDWTPGAATGDGRWTGAGGGSGGWPGGSSARTQEDTWEADHRWGAR